MAGLTPAAPDAGLEVLRAVFGYPSFRPGQEAVVRHTIAGGDSLVLMPTGGGKSLCYQIPALVRPGLGVVISPLIALMQDQVQALLQAGIRAAFLNSTLDRREAEEVEARMAAGELDLVYAAPERVVTPRFLKLLGRCRLALFAIDEAHCVSQWGHDFRPEYLELAVLHRRHPQVPRLALTATADGPTRRDILERLQLGGAPVFSTGFDRPNIRYRVVAKKEPRRQLLEFLDREHPGDAGIVYCLSRRRVEETAGWLVEHGRRALPYHAGLEAETRRAHQERFVREDGVVMVATVAFGMGIDKPDVRFVAHLDPPKSLEAYYQETGRAGRDGLPADAWMAYGLADVVSLRQLLERSEADEAHKRVERRKLEALLAYCETATCRRQVLLRYFGEALEEPCGNCDTCLEPVETWPGTVAAQKALSCAYRTGQRFGAAYLADVLLGKPTDRIVRFGHDGVSTFGIGGELTRPEWLSVYRQLTAAGLLEVDLEGHGGLRLAPASRPVLRGEREVELRRDPAPARRADRRRRAREERRSREIGGPTDLLVDSRLWEALRALRLDLAREQGVPPYVIFHDRTLLEMAHRNPADLAEMAEVPGVGRRKLERYGEAFLGVLKGER